MLRTLRMGEVARNSEPLIDSRTEAPGGDPSPAS
jgi:hypothetical protein